ILECFFPRPASKAFLGTSRAPCPYSATGCATVRSASQLAAKVEPKRFRLHRYCVRGGNRSDLPKVLRRCSGCAKKLPKGEAMVMKTLRVGSLCGVFVGALLVTCIARAQSVAPPALPQGDTGIAASYASDVNIGSDPRVLFFDGFENYTSLSQ